MAGDAGALEYAGIAAMALKFELLKNTINIDKLLKMFCRETTFIICYITVTCKIYIKWLDNILSKFIENKNFF